VGTFRTAYTEIPAERNNEENGVNKNAGVHKLSKP